jgi:hypothetical protein
MSRGSLKLGFFFDTMPTTCRRVRSDPIPPVRYTTNFGMDNVCPAKLCVFQDPQPIISRRGRHNW